MREYLSLALQHASEVSVTIAGTLPLRTRMNARTASPQGVSPNLET